MDKKTINVYDSTAIQIAEFHNTLAPKRIYYLINKFFIGGGQCGDIGCGTGRDTSWLIDQGFDVVGIDGSIGMLELARSHYPNIQFIYDSLPLLARQGDASFVNLLCSAVIMHLPREQIPQAVTNILRVVRIGGIIILSFRGSVVPLSLGLFSKVCYPDIFGIRFILICTAPLATLITWSKTASTHSTSKFTVARSADVSSYEILRRVPFPMRRRP